MLYNVGDKLKVRSDLTRGCVYKSQGGASDVATKSMIGLSGKEVTISRVSENGIYSVLEDGGEYGWTDEMFEETYLESEIQVEKKKENETIIIEDFVSVSSLFVEKVIFNNPATIIFYKLKDYNGNTSKTYKSVAKCNPVDEFDKEKGLEVAILKAVIKEAQRELRRM